MRKEFFPDGTPIDSWFYQTELPTKEGLGKAYVLTDYGVLADGEVHTDKIQGLIERIFQDGGGVLVVPKGKFKTGALFFKQGVHLCVEEGGVLLASDDVSDYPVMQTRMEGESCDYFPAVINADGVDGFCLFGKGTIDGNGLRSWKAFWKRREWNPACTNKDEQRARLTYISNSKNVTVAGLRLQNSQFWTNHIYKCHRVKFLNCDIFSPFEPIKAPSTDGLDIDACAEVLVKNCKISVDDDAIALKGGKGPWADSAPENGGNERILIEDCTFGHCCSALTCGSESIYNKNILMRRIFADGSGNLLWLKMRPDTPQRYEYIRLENVTGYTGSLLLINPWTQFFDLKGRKEIPLSYADKITIKDCDCKTNVFLNVTQDKTQYLLSGIEIENVTSASRDDGWKAMDLSGIELKDVNVTSW